MAKVKYYYDSVNLAYRKIKIRKRRKFGYAVLFLLASALFGFLTFIILLNTPYFDTPKDRLLERQAENLKLNYAILNKKMDEIDDVVEDIEDRDNKPAPVDSPGLCYARPPSLLQAKKRG